jgi:hypothetical protein
MQEKANDDAQSPQGFHNTKHQAKLYGVPGFRGPELIVMECPQCRKRRMHRSEGHAVSLLKEVSKDKERERYIDVCTACLIRYKNEDRDYERRVIKAKKALENGEDLGEGSIEDTL